MQYVKEQPSKKARHSLRILSVQRVETKLMLSAAPRIGIESAQRVCAFFSFNRGCTRLRYFFLSFCFYLLFFLLFLSSSSVTFSLARPVSFQHWLCFFFRLSSLASWNTILQHFIILIGTMLIVSISNLSLLVIGRRFIDFRNGESSLRIFVFNFPASELSFREDGI